MCFSGNTLEYPFWTDENFLNSNDELLPGEMLCKMMYAKSPSIGCRHRKVTLTGGAVLPNGGAVSSHSQTCEVELYFSNTATVC
jgi:hypothetical protein